MFDDEAFGRDVDAMIARGATREQLDAYARSKGQVDLSGYPSFEAKLQQRGPGGLLGGYVRGVQQSARAGAKAGTAMGGALVGMLPQTKPTPAAPSALPVFNYDGSVTVGTQRFATGKEFRDWQGQHLFELAQGSGDTPIAFRERQIASPSNLVDAALGLNTPATPIFNADGSVKLGDTTFTNRAEYQRFNKESALAAVFGTTPDDPKLNDNDAWSRAYRKVMGEDAPYIGGRITADTGPTGADAARDTAPGAVDAFVRGAADFPTLGGADELAAAMDTLFNDKSFKTNLLAERGVDERDARVNPYARIGGQVAGAFLTPTKVTGAARGAAVRTLRAGGTRAAALDAAKAAGTRRMIGEGAVIGGGYGFGSSNGDIIDRVKAGATGTLFGGTIGAVVGKSGIGARNPRVDPRGTRVGPGFPLVAPRIADRIDLIGPSRPGALLPHIRPAPIDTAPPVRPPLPPRSIEEVEPQIAEWAQGQGARPAADDIPDVMLHGSPYRNIEQFDPYGKSGYGLFGMGTYLTDAPLIGGQYSGKGMRAASKTGDAERSVYAVQHTVKKPLDMDAPADVAEWNRVAGEHAEFTPGMTNEEAFRALENGLIDLGDLPRWEGAEMMSDAIRALGYDGMTHIGGGRVGNGPRHRVVIALDPEQTSIKGRLSVDDLIKPPAQREPDWIDVNKVPEPPAGFTMPAQGAAAATRNVDRLDIGTGEPGSLWRHVKGAPIDTARPRRRITAPRQPTLYREPSAAEIRMDDQIDALDDIIARGGAAGDRADALQEKLMRQLSDMRSARAIPNDNLLETPLELAGRRAQAAEDAYYEHVTKGFEGSRRTKAYREHRAEQDRLWDEKATTLKAYNEALEADRPRVSDWIDINQHPPGSLVGSLRRPSGQLDPRRGIVSDNKTPYDAGPVSGTGDGVPAPPAGFDVDVPATPRLRQHAMPADMPPILATFADAPGTARPAAYKALKAHPEYEAAKAGDVPAAVRVAHDLVKPENLQEAARRWPGARFVSVGAQEASGRNKLPVALAALYAKAAGGTVDAGIVQTVRAGHTGAKAIARMLSRPQFDGPVIRGADYVIVDDVSVLGGTAAAMADHITQGGGKVRGVVVLASASKTGTLAPPARLVAAIEERFGDDIRTHFGIEPKALTHDEAEYLARFKSAQSLRDRIAAERNAGGGRAGDGPAEAYAGENLGDLPRPTGGGRSAAMDAEHEIPTLTGPGAETGGRHGERIIDRIDVSTPPPPPGFTMDVPLGRARPLGEQPSPEELAHIAQGVRPEDVRPIPSNVVDEQESAALSEGVRPRLKAPNERDELETRWLPSTRDATRMLPRKGPVDLVGYLRTQGGIRESRGELASLGIDNKPRALDFAQAESRLGKLVDNERGLSLDDAAQRAWEAGYFPNHTSRPTISEFLEALGETHRGGPGRSFLPDDLAEVAAFEQARAQRFRVEAAAQEGTPLADDVGRPISMDDLDANRPPVTAYEDLPKLGGKIGNINLAHIETRGDIRRLLQTTEQRFGGFDAARRGVITRAETAALASELKMTVPDLLKRRQGQALNAEEALAARQLLAKSSDGLLALANKQVRTGSNEDLVAFQKALLIHAAIQEQVSGAAAEAGRALAQYKQLAKASAVGGRVLDTRLASTVGGADRLEKIAQAIVDLQRRGVDPGAVNALAAKALKPKWSDKLVELYYNMLLSGPQTHVVNTLSNTMTAVLQLPEHVAASALGLVRHASPDRVLASEIGARTFGLLQGTREGLRSFARTLRTGDVPDLVTKVEARTQRAISGVKGEIIRTPSRLLAAEDEFFKAIGRRMEVNGLAVRKATGEGLKGQALKARIADLAANPTDDMFLQSLDYARYLTYQRPLKGLPLRVSQATQDAPALKLIVPFVRTPVNILKFVVERSPGAPLMSSWRADFMAGGARRDLAIAKVLLGTGLASIVMQYAQQGRITGSGPLDKNALGLMRADGWQPYSIRIGDTWYAYGRLDPLATTMGVAADLAEKGSHMTARQADQAGWLLLSSIIKNLGDKTWLSGVSDAIEALDAPERRGNAWVGKVAGSMLVPSIVAQATRTIDPVQRDTRSALDYVQNRIPGLSSKLPARRDVWGREIVREGGVGPDFISPIWKSTAKDDPLNREMLDINARFGKPKREIGKLPLNGHQYSELLRIGGAKTEAGIRAAMASREWQDLSAQGKVKLVDKIKRDARAAARTEVLRGSLLSNGILNLKDEAPSTNIEDRTVKPAMRGAVPPPPPGFDVEVPPPPPGFDVPVQPPAGYR